MGNLKVREILVKLHRYCKKIESDLHSAMLYGDSVVISVDCTLSEKYSLEVHACGQVKYYNEVSLSEAEEITNTFNITRCEI